MCSGYNMPPCSGFECLRADAPPRFFSDPEGRSDVVGLSGKLPVLTSPRPAQKSYHVRLSADAAHDVNTL